MIEYKINEIDVSTYLSLRQQVNWKKLTREQAKKALDNSLYIVTAYDGDKAIGMGRIVGDGAVICYVQDLIVVPQAQGSGIGGKILEMLKKHVKDVTLEGTEMMLDLMCAKGREKFYEGHGFISRPTDKLGPGMIMYIKNDALTD